MVSILSLTEDLSFSHRGPFFLSQIYTDEQNTQHSKQVVAPPPSPPQKGYSFYTSFLRLV